LRLFDEGGETLALAESQLKRIQVDIVENLKPVRPLPPFRIFLLACAIIVLCVVALGALRLGINGLGALSVAQRTAIFGALTASGVLLAVSMVGQMAPGSKFALAPAVLPIAVLIFLLLVITLTFHSQQETAFVSDGLVCIKNGLTYSVATAFLLWLLLRRGAMLYPKAIGAAAGGLSGLIGLSVLELNCQNFDVFHILVWHWGVVLISSVAGVLLGTAAEHIEQWRNPRAS
jgi:hypothetical protein